MVSPKPTNYKELRSAYDLAFRQLAQQRRHLKAESNNVVTAQEQLTAAEHCYVQARNNLASYLLCRQAEIRAMSTAPEIFRVTEDVYAVWKATDSRARSLRASASC